ncbi:hypothetical protein ACOSQ2_005354 [Xanthoceras sorbifolium]
MISLATHSKTLSVNILQNLFLVLQRCRSRETVAARSCIVSFPFAGKSMFSFVHFSLFQTLVCVLVGLSHYCYMMVWLKTSLPDVTGTYHSTAVLQRLLLDSGLTVVILGNKLNS